MEDSQPLQFSAHDSAQRAYACLREIVDLKHLRMQLIPGSHAADEPYSSSVRLPGKSNLGTHCIDSIDNIIRLFLLIQNYSKIIRQYKHLIRPHFNRRINIPDPFLHNLCLKPANRTVICDRLPVDICQGHCIVIDQDQCADPAPRQRLDTMRSHASHAEYHDRSTFQPVHTFRSQQELCS